MLNTNDLETIHACVSNYISVAESQRDSLTVGDKNCSPLLEFYTTKINSCYEVLNKINAFTVIEPIQAINQYPEFSQEDLKTAKNVINKLLTLK